MNEKLKYTFLLLAAGLFSVPAGAQMRTDTLTINSRARLHGEAVNAIGAFVYDDSPAAALYRYNSSLTEVGARLDWRDEEQALLQAEGSGLLTGSFEVDSYLKLNANSAAFAGVEYTNGEKRNVLWNSTSDFMLLYPYIVADSIGGDLRTEQYRFRGGYTRQDGRVNYGLQASYRALHEYRQADPRPRSRATELTADLSAGYLFERYSLTGTFGLRVYKQDQDVDYYFEGGRNTIQFHLLGLGAYHGKFSSASDNAMSTNYKGTAYSGAVVLAPRGGNGWFASAKFDDFTVKQYIVAANDTPLTELNVQRLSGAVAYRNSSARMNWGVEAAAEYELRQGTEMVLNNTAGYDNYILGEFTMYRNHISRGHVKGSVEWKREALTWSLRPEISYYRTSSEYLYPHRDMEFSHLTAGAEAGVVWLRDRWLLDAGVAAAYTPNLSSSLTLPESLNTDPNASMLTLAPEVTHVFSRLTTDYATAMLRLRGQYEINRTVALFAAVKWYTHRFRGGLTDNILAVTLGVNF